MPAQSADSLLLLLHGEYGSGGAHQSFALVATVCMSIFERWGMLSFESTRPEGNKGERSNKKKKKNKRMHESVSPADTKHGWTYSCCIELQLVDVRPAFRMDSLTLARATHFKPIALDLFSIHSFTNIYIWKVFARSAQRFKSFWFARVWTWQCASFFFFFLVCPFLDSDRSWHLNWIESWHMHWQCQNSFVDKFCDIFEQKFMDIDRKRSEFWFGLFSVCNMLIRRIGNHTIASARFRWPSYVKQNTESVDG